MPRFLLNRNPLLNLTYCTSLDVAANVRHALGATASKVTVSIRIPRIAEGGKYSVAPADGMGQLVKAPYSLSLGVAPSLALMMALHLAHKCSLRVQAPRIIAMCPAVVLLIMIMQSLRVAHKRVSWVPW
jgi:hypothetical protein